MLFFENSVYSQNVFFGIIYKPIIPEPVFKLGSITANNSQWQVSITPKFSNSFGMLIKKRLNQFLNIESGILYVSRKFNQEISFQNTSPHINRINLVGYEVPIQAIIVVPFSENWSSNSSIGVSADVLSTDLHITYSDFTVSLIRKNWISGALGVNTGMDYEIPKSGNIYLGLSFHQPFKNLIIARFDPADPALKPGLITGLSGAYFTLDLKYYFKPIKNPPKKDTN